MIPPTRFDIFSPCVGINAQKSILETPATPIPLFFAVFFSFLFSLFDIMCVFPMCGNKCSGLDTFRFFLINIIH